jgi:hypothetical protein
MPSLVRLLTGLNVVYDRRLRRVGLDLLLSAIDRRRARY